MAFTQVHYLTVLHVIHIHFVWCLEVSCCGCTPHLRSSTSVFHLSMYRVRCTLHVRPLYTPTGVWWPLGTVASSSFVGAGRPLVFLRYARGRYIATVRAAVHALYLLCSTACHPSTFGVCPAAASTAYTLYTTLYTLWVWCAVVGCCSMPSTTQHTRCAVLQTQVNTTRGRSVPCKHTTHSGVLCTRGTQPVSPSTGLYTTLYTPYGVWVGCDAPHTRRRATRARRESKQRSRLLRHSTAPPVRCRNSRSALLRCAILVPQLGPLVPLRGPCGPAPRP